MLSGNGSNLQAIIDACRAGTVHGEICVVVSDQASAFGLQRARRAGIPDAVVERAGHANRDAFESALSDVLEHHGAELIVLAGFMRILGGQFVARHRGRVLNVHPSLLPEYRGLDTYRRVLDAGERWHGTSVHFVTEELDGGPVVAQARVRIEGGDDADSLRQRVVAREHVLYPQVVDWYCRGWLRMDGDSVRLRGRTLQAPIVHDETNAAEPT